MKTHHGAIVAVAVAAFMSLPAQAMPRPELNVGPAIAAQGNLALARIKADLKNSIASWSLPPAPPAVQTVSRIPGSRAGDGAGIASSAKVQCAP